jgi:MFS superfamily sulfate permease-like transporter
VVLRVRHAAVFSNFLKLKKTLSRSAQNAKDVVVDFAHARLVDHTVMERLHELEEEFARKGNRLHIHGLERHRSLSSHPLAARKLAARPLAPDTSANLPH